VLVVTLVAHASTKAAPPTHLSGTRSIHVEKDEKADGYARSGK
jgi:hypothetical protein